MEAVTVLGTTEDGKISAIRLYNVMLVDDKRNEIAEFDSFELLIEKIGEPPRDVMGKYDFSQHHKYSFTLSGFSKLHRIDEEGKYK